MSLKSRKIASFSLAGATLACLIAILATPALEGRDGNQEAAPVKPKLVLHEWGTFTNFSGASGAYLDYRPLTEDLLPRFIHNPWNALGLSKFAIVARQRMETPVAYFYSDVPREVQVRVDFPAGLLTEWYPAAKMFGPKDRIRNLKTAGDSFLDWGIVRILPPAEFAKVKVRGPDNKPIPAELPPVPGDDHYGYARETDAAILETVDPLYRGSHFEKFLFYRGIGNFDLPVKFAALGHDRFEVTNFGGDALGDMFLVHIDGECVRYTHHAGVPAHGAHYLELSPAESNIEELAEEMIAKLSATGLYEKEARAMVKTWRSNWFGEAGTRLLYLVPQPLTDAIIPLRVSPPPDEVVRVLVGRMEVLTPEAGERIAAMVREAGTCFSPEIEPLSTELTALGRFAEPALESLIASASDADLRAKLELLLAAARP